jgi:hypothetical protein
MHGSDHMMFLSQKQNNHTDPLDWKFKTDLLQRARPSLVLNRDKSIRTPFEALESFEGQYQSATLVVGSDQLLEFTQRMTPYAEKWGIKLNVVSAGTRLSGDSGVAGVSATQLRALAQAGQQEMFCKKLIGGLSRATQLDVYRRVRKALSI